MGTRRRGTRLIVDRGGMVSSGGAKLFRVTTEGVLFLDKKDRRRVSERLGNDCVCIPVGELIELLQRHCVEMPDAAATKEGEGIDVSLPAQHD